MTLHTFFDVLSVVCGLVAFSFGGAALKQALDEHEAYRASLTSPNAQAQAAEQDAWTLLWVALAVMAVVFYVIGG